MEGRGTTGRSEPCEWGATVSPLQYDTLRGVLGEVDPRVSTVHPEDARSAAQCEGHATQRDGVERVTLLESR